MTARSSPFRARRCHFRTHFGVLNDSLTVLWPARAVAGGDRLTQTATLGAYSGAMHSLTVSYAVGGEAAAGTSAALQFVATFAATFEGSIYKAVRPLDQ